LFADALHKVGVRFASRLVRGAGDFQTISGGPDTFTLNARGEIVGWRKQVPASPAEVAT